MSANSDTLLNTTGIRLPSDACVVIVRTEWNAATVDKLEAGCRNVLDENYMDIYGYSTAGLNAYGGVRFKF